VQADDLHWRAGETRAQLVEVVLATLSLERYTPKSWNLAGLAGITDRTLETHFGLYEGYVKNTNLLNEQLAEVVKTGRGEAANPHFAELTRRLGFEYNGMRLHELYFENLTTNGGGAPQAAMRDAFAASFGDVESWKRDFVGTAGMRGVGWAIAYQDPRTGMISNHWITLHEAGHPAGFTPILVLDVWEHAFMLDYKPSERGKYIDAFFANVDWGAVTARLRPPSAA
jgi:Fe-Mn family superoxide dismutase